MTDREFNNLQIELHQLRDVFVGFARAAMIRDPAIRRSLRKLVNAIDDRITDYAMELGQKSDPRSVEHAMAQIGFMRTALFDGLPMADEDPTPHRKKLTTKT
jgi:hypothetical protein